MLRQKSYVFNLKLKETSIRIDNELNLHHHIV